jgi:hypothetical protein
MGMKVYRNNRKDYQRQKANEFDKTFKTMSHQWSLHKLQAKSQICKGIQIFSSQAPISFLILAFNKKSINDLLSTYLFYPGKL